MAQEKLDTIPTILADDIVALNVAIYLGDGYTAKEAEAALGLTPTEYAAAVRRLRRRLQSLNNHNESPEAERRTFHFRREWTLELTRRLIASATE